MKINESRYECVPAWTNRNQYGIFDFFRPKNINQGIEEYRKTEGAVLLDVRTPEEYSEGHIENSVNIPVQEIDRAGERLPKKDAALFLYCHSGVRSAHAVRLLKKIGYTKVNDIGGILSYRGETVK